LYRTRKDVATRLQNLAAVSIPFSAMASQRQVFRNRRPGSVTFALAGRTTLTEHSPTENIEVAYDVAERSPYLRNFLPQHASNNRPLLPIQLGDVDPAVFRLYITWLSTGTISPPSQTAVFLQSCTDLIYAHILGAIFHAPNFQDHVIDTIASILDPAQAPDIKILEILFLEKHASSMLKRFVIDKMFAHERKMLGMLRGFVEDMVTGKGDVKGCEYHVHDEGVCYKHGREDKGVVLKKETGMEKKWTIDDDAELNAMAAHYLGKTSSTTEPSSKVSKTSARPRLTVSSVLTDGDLVTSHSAAPPSSRSNTQSMHTTSVRYQGSASWSRDLHNPRSSVRSLDTHPNLDKPLPPPPKRLPPPPPPLRSPADPKIRLAAECEPIQATSTNDLVLECLGRLSPSTMKPSTRDLINECLARVLPSPTTMHIPPYPDNNEDNNESIHSSLAASTCSSSSSSSEDHIPSSPCPDSLLYPPNPVTRDFSFTSLPKPKFPHPPLTPPYHKSLSSTPHLPPLIIRKPAPPRGTDWLEQWDRLHALKGTQGFGLRKHGKRGRERKSRFKEILGSVRG
jgi:hypothetical protein